MRLWRMRTGISITVTPSDRLRLEVLVRDRNAPQKRVWRAEIVLLSADGVGTNEIKRRTNKFKTCVWRWQERFTRDGFEDLLRDETRPLRVAPLGAEVAARVVALTQNRSPSRGHALDRNYDGEGGWHQRKLGAAHLAGARTATASRPAVQALDDPNFVDKLHDVVGLYVNPPEHAIVLSVDEKSQIQALDRTQPGLP
jgi:hypothetical protein